MKINNRYEIIKSIGEGGMANVYLAKDIILERDVAVKVLRTDLSEDETFIRRFQREALSASSLSHQNVVSVYDVGEDNGKYYIVMEYIKGETLKHLIRKRKKLTLIEAVDIMLQITDGLSAAHDIYIIHRDLKSQNIMIDVDGSVKITDFGIAMAQNSSSLTQTNSVMGSVHYLPPEQASGKKATLKGDIYSLGILFYELLTGELPFRGENAVEIALKQMKEPMPSVRRINKDIPQSIENIILKATAKNPKNRFENVKDMHKALANALEIKDVEKIVFDYSEEIETKGEEQPKIRKVYRRKEDLGGDNKKEKVVIYSLVGVLAVLIGILLLVFVPQFFKGEKDVVIPDVTGLEVREAEEILVSKGLKVADETEKVASSKITKGKVVKTSPLFGKHTKTGRTVVIYESTGEEEFVLEDYGGKIATEVSSNLKKLYGLKVKIETKKVDDGTMFEAGTILEHNPQAGSKVKKGDEIILYVPDLLTAYPDFKGKNIQEVEEFAKKYGLELKRKVEITTNYEDGEILRQSRKAGDNIVKGATFEVVYAKKIVDDTGRPE